MIQYWDQQIFTPGGRLRLHNASCVKREDHFNTYSVAAVGHWAMEVITGIIIRCWAWLWGFLTNAFEPGPTSLSVRKSIFLWQEGMFNQHHQKSYCLNTTSARHDSCFEYDEASDHMGIDSIVAGKMAKSHEKKLTKYQELVSQCRMKGWQVHWDPIDIGCRWFVAQSLFK